jgi:hypothetical protein
MQQAQHTYIRFLYIPEPKSCSEKNPIPQPHCWSERGQFNPKGKDLLSKGAADPDHTAGVQQRGCSGGFLFEHHRHTYTYDGSPFLIGLPPVCSASAVKLLPCRRPFCGCLRMAARLTLPFLYSNTEIASGAPDPSQKPQSKYKSAEKHRMPEQVMG